MGLRIVVAAVLSAIAMFLWGFIFWGPVLGMTARLMSPLPADAELDVLAPLRASKTPDGMYVYPGPLAAGSDEAAQKVWTEKIAAGPIIHMAYHRGGTSPMAPATLAQGLAHSFVIALLGGATLALAAPAAANYGRRVGILVLVSLIAALWTNVGNVIWWFHSTRYAAGQIAYTAVAGLLMALITAAIVRPRTPAP